MPFIVALLLALLAGAALTVQVGLNNGLRIVLADAVLAALASFLVGAVVLVAVAVASRSALPAASRIAAYPWWTWLGGTLGAAYVLSTIVLAPRLGPGLLFGAVVLGQMAASVVVEHFGLLGFDRHPASLVRVAGVLLIVGGVALVRR